jgi:diadenosine tetraphosphate (Ap4A) HIT family hydrolase
MNLFDGCEFCAQVERTYTIINRILYQSDNLTVWPSLGALGHGHLLVLPNHHRTGFLDFDGDQCREFFNILSAFKSAFDVTSTGFLIGEHGRQ